MKQDNLWAPWRMPYIQSIEVKEGCFLCEYLNNPQADEENFVLWRTSLSLVVMNRFPYNNGHLLIAPNRHIADFSQAEDDELLELNKLLEQVQKALNLAVSPHGYNVGINFGRCAGAGLPGHLHVHLVPRWSGDTNFMSTCGDTKVISQSMKELYDLLRRVSSENNLPSL